MDLERHDFQLEELIKRIEELLEQLEHAYHVTKEQLNYKNLKNWEKRIGKCVIIILEL